MPVNITSLVLGNEYDRPFLATLWGYDTFHAIGRGVVTPRGQNIVVLFITEQNQSALPQYDNRFDGELLWMDGEEGHGSDQRLATSRGRDQVYLFYRGKSHSLFRYCGEVFLVESFTGTADRPSRFVFTSRPALVKEADAALNHQQNGLEDTFDTEPEGRQVMRLHIVYERSKKNRQKALEIHGHKCMACGFDFDLFYGADLADAYIEVHHKESNTQINGQTVNPATDLAPVCANEVDPNHWTVFGYQ